MHLGWPMRNRLKALHVISFHLLFAYWWHLWCHGCWWPWSDVSAPSCLVTLAHHAGHENPKLSTLNDNKGNLSLPSKATNIFWSQDPIRSMPMCVRPLLICHCNKEDLIRLGNDLWQLVEHWMVVSHVKVPCFVGHTSILSSSIRGLVNVLLLTDTSHNSLGH